MYRKKYNVFFVGIGGIGMSGIAELLINLGYNVAGSDLKTSDITDRLKSLGATIFKGHNADNIKDASVVVKSSAIKDSNPEIIAARANSIPVIPRAEMLAELMRLKYSIAVAGAHGKTSTTSIVSSILEQGGLDPTVVIGGKLKSLGTNAFLGQGDFIVAEADESDGSFLQFSPTIAIVTNIDKEHLDFYKDIDDIKNSFLSFIEKIPFYGLAILCADNEHVNDILPKIKKRFITYGIHSDADLVAKDLKFNGPRSQFTVYYLGEKLGDIKLNLPGIHNISNCLAGIAVGLELGISFDIIQNTFETIEGVQRRLEFKGETKGITIMDDYGHHPTEIEATLSAIRKSWPKKRISVLFQPHRYTRTKALFKNFITAFNHSDNLLILPIYSAGEEKIDGVDSCALCKQIENNGHKNVFYFDTPDQAIEKIKNIAQQGEIVLTLGAGDVWKIGEEIFRQLCAI